MKIAKCMCKNQKRLILKFNKLVFNKKIFNECHKVGIFKAYLFHFGLFLLCCMLYRAIYNDLFWKQSRSETCKLSGISYIKFMFVCRRRDERFFRNSQKSLFTFSCEWWKMLYRIEPAKIAEQKCTKLDIKNRRTKFLLQNAHDIKKDTLNKKREPHRSHRWTDGSYVERNV